MTITFLQPDGVPITALAERQGSAALYGGGSGRQLGGRSGFRVGTPADTLSATSTVWTLKPCSAQIDPGATTHQGMYGWASDADVTGAVTAADATYARKDIVYVQVNDSSAGDGSGAKSADVLYLAGAASATPVAPTLPARSFLVGTISVPVAGGGAPTVALNPARFVAAGGILPATLSERDALVKHDGLSVQRMDVAGRPTEVWDASAADWFGSVTPAPVLGGWTLTGSLHRTGGAAGTQVAAAFKAIYGGGTFTLNSSFVLAFTLSNAGHRPVGNDAYGYFMLRAVTTRDVKADCAFTINPAGEVYVRTLLGQAATTIAAGDELSFNTVWNA